MIKRLCVLAAITVLSIGIVACSNDEKQDPSTETAEEVADKRPNLNLVYKQDGKEVTSGATRGGYSCTIDNGDGTKTSETTDASHILQWSDELMSVIVMDNNSQTLKIVLEFNKKATNCKVIAWEEKYFNNDTDIQESDGKEVKVQYAEDGHGEYYFVEVSPGYIYEVKAEGEEWKSDFGFRVVN